MILETIGQLAVDLHAATLARKGAKYELRDKYAEFCLDRGLYHGEEELHYVREDHPEYWRMQEYSSGEIEAYRRAQLDEYNLKRKLDRAVRRYTAPAQLAKLRASVEVLQ